MASDFYSQVVKLVSARQLFAVATVIQVEGSASARRGSKALIDAEGRRVTGWVGGGCAESAVRTEALKCMSDGQARTIHLDMSDERLGIGMPCGGRMDIFIEPVLPKPELLILGHGNIAEHLAALGDSMGFAVVVNDPGADRAAFPSAQRLVNEDFDRTETPVGPGSFVVVATQHKNDHLWLMKALEGSATYVALIASQHRARLVLDYLRSAGVDEEKIATVWAPAGLDLGAATPEEIALSVISQAVAIRRGASMAPLKGISSKHPGRTDGLDEVILACEFDERS
jgi:xanthine dehydrogenase accessory factor